MFYKQATVFYNQGRISMEDDPGRTSMVPSITDGIVIFVFAVALGTSILGLVLIISNSGNSGSATEIIGWILLIVGIIIMLGVCFIIAGFARNAKNMQNDGAKGAYSRYLQIIPLLSEGNKKPIL